MVIEFVPLRAAPFWREILFVADIFACGFLMRYARSMTDGIIRRTLIIAIAALMLFGVVVVLMNASSGRAH